MFRCVDRSVLLLPLRKSVAAQERLAQNDGPQGLNLRVDGGVDPATREMSTGEWREVRATLGIEEAVLASSPASLSF